MARRVLLPLLVAAGLALGLFPALAAAGYSVNTFNDAVDSAPADGVCDSDAVTAGQQCSLRAAIETANSTPAADQVGFSSSGQTVALTEPLAIEQPLSLLGCASQTATEPCISVRGAGIGIEGLIVRADNTTISGLALSNALSGIEYEAGFSGLVVRNDWLGLSLGGGSDPDKYGLNLLGNQATVGGVGSGDRNVVGFNEIGVRVYEGDRNQILGNYVGVKANGATVAANSAAGVAVISNKNDLAEDNVVGGTVSAAAAATAVCDGACNVISANNSRGVRLWGSVSPESPAVGTIVRGNFVGLAANGTTALANGIGIDVSNAPGSVIGGPSVEERNYVVAAITGITMSSVSPAISVIGNFIGLNSSGSAALGSISTAGILAGSAAATPNTVSKNRIVLSAGIGIDLRGAGIVSGNWVGLGAGGQSLSGGTVGIRAQNAGQTTPTRWPITIAENAVANSTVAGIQLEGGQAATVTSNQVSGSASQGSISLKAGSTQASVGDVIGGEGAAANQIENNAAGAPGILIEGATQKNDEILANAGTAKSIFVDLAPATGPGNEAATGANAGIQAPVVSAAGAASAAGTAAAGAKVRVFLSTSAAGQVPAGVGTYLGSATADGSGHWTASFGSALSNGAVVAASQTDAAGNSSELGSGVAADTSGPPAPVISAGPSGLTNLARPSFGFSGDGTSTLRCWIDGAAKVDCPAGTYAPAANLADGAHVFHVIQVNGAGNPSPEATRSFSVDTVAAAPVIAKSPADPTKAATQSFEFTGEAGAAFQCKLDGAAASACASPFTPAVFADGRHVFEITQTDQAGNVSAAAKREFTVDTVAAAPAITAKPSDPTNQRQPSIAFSGEAGATFQCKLDGAASACASPFTPPSLSDGHHVFEVSQTDLAGNVSAASFWGFTVDSVVNAPLVTKSPADPTKVATQTFEFTGEAGATFRCKFDGAAASLCASPFTPAAFADGRHSFEVTQTDAAGNVSAAAQREFTVDTVAVAPLITKSPADPTKVATQTFEFSGEAGAAFQCKLDGVASACASPFTPAAFADGHHVFEVLQTDALGNSSTAAKREFTVDTVAPLIPSITSGPAAGATITETTPTFSFTGNDPTASSRCKVDGAPTGCSSPFTLSKLAKGAHTFGVAQVDAAGNEGPEVTRSFTVAGLPCGDERPGCVGHPDRTPPDTAIKGPAKLKRPTGKFLLSSTEAGSTFQCQLDRKPYAPCTATFKAKKLKPGKHTLSVKAVDAAGNVDPTPAKKVLRVSY